MDDRKMFYGASKNVFKKAFMLRSNETKSEKELWEHLNKNQLFGLRFKRQHPIGDFAADFYCHKAKLVIELDGGYHDRPEQKLYDENRTRLFEEFGLSVVRFSDEDIFQNLDQVIELIKNKVIKSTAALNP